MYVRRPGGSCQGGLNFQGLQSLMAAPPQPLVAASHEEALRNVRKLLRAEHRAVTELRLTLRYEPLGVKQGVKHRGEQS